MGSTITIDDIAQALGVSKTTVSRAISGKGRISASTTERVRRYIEEHNFKPNAMAQGLAQQRTFNLGVVCPIEYEIFNLPYFHNCMCGISDVTAAHGYDMLISMIDGDNIANLRRVVENHKVDGVVLTRTLVNDVPAQYLKESGIPFVVIGSSPDEELVQIDNDHFSACCELTSILIGKGYRNLGLVGGGEDHIVTRTRKQGFLEAYRRAGLSEDLPVIYMNAGDDSSIWRMLDDVMLRGLDGIVCMDEKIAENVLMQCREKGIRIPEDLKLASFYNSTFLQHAVPAVTALDIDDTRLGTVAAKTLLSMISGERVGSQHLKNYQIILRESTT